VTCHAGDPIVDAWVDVWDPVTWWAYGWASTNHDGYYTTTGLAPVTYEMRVTPPEGAYLAPAYIYDTVVIASETTTVDVILKPYPDPTAIFDTGAPNNPCPSIAGTHTGTITPNQTISATKLYTYALPGTGGHTRSVRIWNQTWSVFAEWTGYTRDWRNITFPRPFTLKAGERYNYEIITGPYPQIHYTPALQTGTGWMNCTGFVDVNGNLHQGWIPAIRLE